MSIKHNSIELFSGRKFSLNLKSKIYIYIYKQNIMITRTQEKFTSSIIDCHIVLLILNIETTIQLFLKTNI